MTQLPPRKALDLYAGAVEACSRLSLPLSLLVVEYISLRDRECWIFVRGQWIGAIVLSDGRTCISQYDEKFYAPRKSQALLQVSDEQKDELCLPGKRVVVFPRKEDFTLETLIAREAKRRRVRDMVREEMSR